MNREYLLCFSPLSTNMCLMKVLSLEKEAYETACSALKDKNQNYLSNRLLPTCINHDPILLSKARKQLPMSEEETLEAIEKETKEIVSNTLPLLFIFHSSLSFKMCKISWYYRCIYNI
jgi:hypothetical protein